MCLLLLAAGLLTTPGLAQTTITTTDGRVEGPLYVKAINTGAGDFFGRSVAADGDTFVVAAPLESSASADDPSDDSLTSSGSVHVYVREPDGDWQHQAFLKADNAGSGDTFGSAVALSGDTLVIGAAGEGSAASGVDGNGSDNTAPGAGAVYVFVRDGNGTWTQQAYLKASNPDAEDGFGSSVDIDGDRIVVGAPFEDSFSTGVDGNQLDDTVPDAGAAYVFVRDESGNWTQEAYLKAHNTGAGDQFGSSVGITTGTLRDIVVVGALGEDSSATGIDGDGSDDSLPDAGAAYLYYIETFEPNEPWIYADYLKPSEAFERARFGSSVAIDGRDVLVGAPYHGVGEIGAAFLFKENASIDSTFEYAYIVAPNADFGDLFGGGVDVRGGRIVIGARDEASGSAGVDGNQADNSTLNAGAAYVYQPLGGRLWHTAYLKANNPDPNDYFGSGDVAIGNEFVVIGAHLEDSASVGIGGNPQDDSLSQAGAAYVYDAPAIYTMSVDIENLAGSGMRGRLNGVERNATSPGPASAIGFNEPALFDGDEYTFEIIQQPSDPDQICEPFTITGVIDGPPEDLIVTCPVIPPPPSYPVGGAVTGLVGSGLVLRLNDGDDLSIAGNGAFEFSNPLEQGGSYGVTVASQPTSPDQFCVVGQGAGIVGEGPIDDVEVRCAQPLPVADYAVDAYIKATNTDSRDEYASSIALDGNTLVVGAPGEDSAIGGIGGPPANNAGNGSGAVYVYVRDELGGWTPQAYIKAPFPEDGDAFGSAVALSGDTLAVAAIGEDSDSTGFNGDQLNDDASDSGAVYVLTRNGSGQWLYEAYLKPSNTDSDDEFGASLALDGDTLVVGAPAEDGAAPGVDGDDASNDARDSGAAYVFVRDGTTWSQQAYLKATNPDIQDDFGNAVALRGDRIVVGSPGEDSSSNGVDANPLDNEAPAAGAVYVFDRFGTTWTPSAYIKALDPETGDQFGDAVALTDEWLAVAAYREDGPGNATFEAGTVYLFEWSGAAWAARGKLRPTHPDAEDQFGIDIDLDGDRLVVGAWLEDSASSGVGGDGSDDSLTRAGAAYLFRLFDGAWQFEHYLKPSVTDFNDQFGRTVALSNGLIAVGSIAEDGSSTGLGGDPLDNAATSAGAVWTFDATRTTIGGQVDGLAGSGLVLELVGVETLPVASDGSFTFATPVASGSPWEVRVAASPTGPDQTCEVVNGSGVLGSQAVVDVQVDCSSGFTIGGTVVGAEGPGLVLRNAGEDLTITANGAFAFVQAVADGGAYAVSIVSTPDSPPQQCQLINGSGTVQGAPVSDVQVQCQTLYRVRGDVAGAAGPGLVLQNNGGDDLTITSNGPFQFEGLLLDGEAYAVTVRSSPASPPQNCIVGNGSGTVQGQNVVDVQVTCRTFHAIGGTVTGAAGPGLVLQNNGGDDLAIAANGPFQFGQLQLPGSTYDVTVLSAPSSPEQLCRVLDGSGTVGQGDVTDIVVQCRLARRIGGTVTGLEGSGLVLELNGEAQLPISTNGPFQFPDPIPDGFTYDVTVVGFPQAPEQACTVTNGSGTASGGDVADVAIACETTAETGRIRFRTGLIEVDEADGMAMVEVERVGGTDGVIEVAVVSQAGSAVEGVDYLAVNETLIWADGDATVWPVAVGLVDDVDAEPVEDFELVLVRPSYQTPLGSPATVSIRIFDDETVLFASGFED
ncbi:hypothetical protein HFP89_12730 [Wenzhouxiangella sp. XN79A]|uniref:Calx-beta domain-containing protein n=1 Tax=Wenzhouxiangella sp. XN79A TaxID=2724193 RepID=UPI00144AE4D3|nr:hypothetical protein [Wenzhouxiangella sp. XN79A]